MPININDNLANDAPTNSLIQVINMLATRLKGLSGGSSWKDAPTSSITGWREAQGTIESRTVDKIRVTGTTTINLPINPTASDIEILTTGFQSICNINFNGGLYQQSSIAGAKLAGVNKYARLVFVNSEVGWTDINQPSQLSIIPIGLIPYQDSPSLWIEGGELGDKSGFGRDLRASINGQEPIKTTGLDNRQVFRWTDQSSKSLYTLPFLNGASGATLYVVLSVSLASSYNVVQTTGLDDYWYFSGDGKGYIGTFLDARREEYPSNMPASGNHLISIHASSNTYQVCVDNLARPPINVNFTPGNFFTVRPDTKKFVGDIALVLVYSEFISPTSGKHTSNISAIKANYPSLPFTN